MSTDRQRLQSAIQRIAKQDPDLSAIIGASKNKGGQASSSGIGISDADRDNLCCDGTAGAGANAGTDQRDPDQDGEDGLDDTDPADLTMGQGSLTGVTDCATGEPICFDGGDWIPPDGWDSPTDPPLDDTWQKEFSWDNLGNTFDSPGTWTCRGPGCCLFCAGNLSVKNTDSEGVPISYSFAAQCEGFGGCNGSTILNRFEDPLNTDQPRLDFWPADNCTNLVIKGGKIVGSKYDPENDGSYSAPRDELEVCDDAGNRILLRGSPAGGWKSIKSLEGDIDPDTGNGYLYRPNGQRVRQISPSEFRDDTV